MSMVKYFLRNSFFASLLLIFSFSLSSQSMEDLFNQVFGKTLSVTEFETDLLVSGVKLGTVTVMDNRGLYSVNRSDLYDLLNRFYLSEKVNFLINHESKWITFEDLEKQSVEAVYDPFNLSLNLILPPLWKRVVNLGASGESIVNEDREFVVPSLWGGALNLSPRLSLNTLFENESIFDTSLSGDYFLRWGNFVWEQDFYFSEKNFQTDEFRLVRPPEDSSDFLFLGKTTTFGIGFQQRKSIWGISVADSFYYRFQNEKKTHEDIAFFLDESSTVAIYHENRLIHTYRLNPGPYTLSDFNLSSGINKINVIILTDSGKKIQDEYYIPYEDNLLAPGTFVRVLNAGMNYEKLDNSDADLLFLSGAFQYGLFDNLSLNAGLQGSENYFTADGGLLFLSPFGSFQFNSAFSADRTLNSGLKNGFVYSYKTPQLKYPVLLVSALQYTGAGYSKVMNNATGYNETAVTYSVNQMLPAQSSVFFETGLIFNNSESQDFSLKTGVSLGMIPRLSMQVTLEMSQDDEIGTNYNMLFQISTNNRDYGTTSIHYDARNGSMVFKSPLSMKDNGTMPDVGLTVSSLTPGNSLFYGGGLDASWLTPWFSQTGNLFFKMKEETAESLTMNWNGNISLVGAAGAYSISKPVLGSFALFETDTELAEPVYIERYQDSYAAVASVFPGVAGALDFEVPRDLHVFTNNLEPGLSFDKEVFSVYPPYKSIYRINLKIVSSVFCRGYIYDENGEALVYTAGELSGKDLEESILFFTDESGRFELFGLNPGVYSILLYVENETVIPFEIPAGSKGYFDAGSLYAETREGK